MLIEKADWRARDFFPAHNNKTQNTVCRKSYNSFVTVHFIKHTRQLGFLGVLLRVSVCVCGSDFFVFCLCFCVLCVLCFSSLLLFFVLFLCLMVIEIDLFFLCFCCFLLSRCYFIPFYPFQPKFCCFLSLSTVFLLFLSPSGVLRP